MANKCGDLPHAPRESKDFAMAIHRGTRTRHLAVELRGDVRGYRVNRLR